MLFCIWERIYNDCIIKKNHFKTKIGGRRFNGRIDDIAWGGSADGSIDPNGKLNA